MWQAFFLKAFRKKQTCSVWWKHFFLSLKKGHWKDFWETSRTSGYATSWIGLSSWKGNWIKNNNNNPKNLGIISRSTSCQITILLLFFNYPFSFVWCNLSTCSITDCPGALIDCYNSIYWAYFLFLTALNIFL